MGGGLIAKRIFDKIMFFWTIIYLVVSFYLCTFGNANFSWKSLFNTDGLTLTGIVATFVYAVLLKSGVVGFFIKKLFIQGKTFDYKLSLLFKYRNGLIGIDAFKKKFDEGLAKNKKIISLDIDPKGGSKASQKFFYRNIYSNVIFSTDDEMNEFTISIDGGIKYYIIMKLVEYIVLEFLETSMFVDKFALERITLRLNTKNSEIKVSNYCVNENLQKYEITSANIRIDVDDFTSITVSDKEIKIDSINKGSFYKANEIFKNIICNSI